MATPTISYAPGNGEDLACGEPVYQRCAVEGHRLVNDPCLNPGKMAVEHGGPFVLERRRAIAGLGPAHRAVRRDACTLHGGDDLGAVGALRGDAAVGEASCPHNPKAVDRNVGAGVEGRGCEGEAQVRLAPHNPMH